ncbi:hypothetical protein A3L09_07835 [Thermococcus profundus]|uniref:Uncharacterized protein n=1 Tax=Thermococcus profundus TaxID=49899 RepID=A0A2Z2MCE9_THEPR|nr:hypothetical protein [Thermococcus profundus]ASJ03169.1 hypothetical protein A3L09_07835 [Thermococcus profundus]
MIRKEKIYGLVIFTILILELSTIPYSLAYGDKLWEGTLSEVKINVGQASIPQNWITYAAGNEFFVIGVDNTVFLYSINGTLLWKNSFDSLNSTGVITSIAVQGNTIALSVDSGAYGRGSLLYLLNATSGSVIWERKTAPAGSSYYSDVRYFPNLITVSVSEWEMLPNGFREYVLAYDPNGNLLWNFTVPKGNFPVVSVADVEADDKNVFLLASYVSSLEPPVEFNNRSSTLFVLARDSGELVRRIDFDNWHASDLSLTKNAIVVALYQLVNGTSIKGISDLVGLSYTGNMLWNITLPGLVALDSSPYDDYIAVTLNNVTINFFPYSNITSKGSYLLLIKDNGTIIGCDFPHEDYNGTRYPHIESAPVLLPNTGMIFTAEYLTRGKSLMHHNVWTRDCPSECKQFLDKKCSGYGFGFGGSGSISGGPFFAPGENIPMFKPLLSPNKEYLLYLTRDGDRIHALLLKTHGIISLNVPQFSGLKVRIPGSIIFDWDLHSPVSYWSLPWGNYTLELLNGTEVVYSTTFTLKPDSYTEIFVPFGKPLKEIPHKTESVSLNETKVTFNATTEIYRIEEGGKPAYYINHRVNVLKVEGDVEALRIIFNVSKEIAHDVSKMRLPPSAIIIQREPVIAFDIKDPKEGKEYSKGFEVLTNATPEEVAKGIIVEHTVITGSEKKAGLSLEGVSPHSNTTSTTTTTTTEENKGGTTQKASNSRTPYILVGLVGLGALGVWLYRGKGKK